MCRGKKHHKLVLVNIASGTAIAKAVVWDTPIISAHRDITIASAKIVVVCIWSVGKQKEAVFLEIPKF